MKRIYTLILILTSLSGYAQEFNYTMSGRLEVKEQIGTDYRHVRAYLARAFEDSRKGIEVDTDGLIVAKFNTSIENPRTLIEDDYFLIYNLEFWFNDEGVQVVMTNIYSTAYVEGLRKAEDLLSKTSKRGQKKPVAFNLEKSIKKIMSDMRKELQ